MVKTAQTITVAGQLLTVEPFTDYAMQFLAGLYSDENELIYDLKIHSQCLELITESICALPASLVKISKNGRYVWQQSLSAFAELVGGLTLCYWRWIAQEATGQAKDNAEALVKSLEGQLQGLQPQTQVAQSRAEIEAEIARLQALRAGD
ncbi:hypothetical protein GS597_01470 [Synechococcales cyanobacterium C]|uniref:Uncharacterized protein n=1 Tax=Petrachloros mirabilis ULC683 TaxID=2781853 RepID=A0A8K2AGS3_9CYAN|nr:hypothetical protein [Petrachloros mirabilis]NCJ05209.1 hypothetical protein [Petrachloros mirabilis ULC683]